LPSTLPSVRAECLSLGYDSKVVLDGVSFTFEAGRISVILGPGGSGKSTLLKALGAIPLNAGMPWLRGFLDLPDLPPVAMPQKPRPPRSTLAALLDGASGGVIDAVRVLHEVWRPAPEAAEFLEPVLHLPLEGLSYAHVRLAELTAAVATAPYILLDEPEVGLDARCQEWIIRRLVEFRGERTIIVATHHLGVARAVAEFAILLSEGASVEAGSNPPFFDRPRHPRTRHFVRMGS